MESSADSKMNDIAEERLAIHVVQAVKGWLQYSHYFFTNIICAGFFRSIALRNQDALQDILRLLTLWFKFGQHDEVSHAMGSGFSTVEVDTWLQVIPQVNFNSTNVEASQLLFIRSLPVFKPLMQISGEILITC
jgi:serine/threonine-protein kinase mTOR